MRRAAGLLAALALATQAGAQTPAPPPAPPPAPACLTPAEFTALATYTLPGAVTAVADRCSASLPADAFLRTGATALATRYRQTTEASWPGARAAFLKLSASASPDTANIIAAMPDPSLRGMVSGLFAGVIATHVRLDDCPTIDRTIALLAPLPPEATAELIGVAVGLGSRGGPKKLGQITICGAPQGTKP